LGLALAVILSDIYFYMGSSKKPDQTHLESRDAAEGEKVYNQKCKVCHQIGDGAKNFVGPELNGVIGRKTGSVPDYNYSDANKSSGITWDEATLNEYLTNPKAKIPGAADRRVWQRGSAQFCDIEVCVEPLITLVCAEDRRDAAQDRFWRQTSLPSTIAAELLAARIEKKISRLAIAASRHQTENQTAFISTIARCS
jgi:cytochrome c2